MPRLKQHHIDLLQRLVEEGGISTDQLDGRILRPLRSLGLVEVSAGSAVVTRTGREQVSPRENGSAAAKISKLSHAQEDLLRMLVRQRGIPAEDADARTVRALESRGLVRNDEDRLVATARGVEILNNSDPQTHTRRRGRRPRQDARAEAIMRAVDQLEQAIPPGSEVLVGPIMAYAEDVLSGFRTFARRRMKNGEPQDAEKRKGSAAS